MGILLARTCSPESQEREGGGAGARARARERERERDRDRERQRERERERKCVCVCERERERECIRERRERERSTAVAMCVHVQEDITAGGRNVCIPNLLWRNSLSTNIFWVFFPFSFFLLLYRCARLYMSLKDKSASMR